MNNATKLENGPAFVKFTFTLKPDNQTDWSDYSAWQDSWPDHAEYAVGMRNTNPING